MTRDVRQHAAFSADGSRLLTGSSDGTVRQWDPRTGEVVEPPYERHSSGVSSVIYSPDGEWVASGSGDRTIRVWRARGREDVAILHGHENTVLWGTFSPDGEMLATSGRDGTVILWDWATGKIKTKLACL